MPIVVVELTLKKEATATVGETPLLLEWSEIVQPEFLISISISLCTRWPYPRATLRNNDKIRILSVSVVNDNPSLIPAVPLFDTLSRSEP